MNSAVNRIAIETEALNTELKELQEEERRLKMFKMGNIHPGCTFKWGETVHDAELGTCTVIGLPSKTAMTPAPGRFGVIGTAWVKSMESGTRAWREDKALSLVGKAPAAQMTHQAMVAHTRQTIAAQRAGGSKVADDNNADDGSADDDDYDVDSEGSIRARDVPELAHIERNRKKKLKPTTKKGAFQQNKKSRTTKETSVKLINRVKEFPDTGLTVEAGVLWCAPCKRRMANLKTSIATHVASAVHLKQFERYKKRNDADSQLRESLVAYFEENPMECGVSAPHLKSQDTLSYACGPSLPLSSWLSMMNDTHIVFVCTQASILPEVHALRYRTTEAFLASGTPLERLPYFRELIERGSGALTDVSHLRSSYVPMIESEQLTKVRVELHQNNAALSIQFDGTTRLGEAIVCVGRYCTKDFRIVKRLLMLKTTARHMLGKQLSAVITQLLCTTLQLDPLRLAGISRDSASVNGAACNRLMSNPFVNALTIMCICHTINNAGHHLELPLLNEWMTPWLDLIGGRNPHQGAKNLWKHTVEPMSVPGFSNVRWYAKAEICYVIAKNFDKLPEFLDSLDELGYGEATRNKLRNLWENQRDQLELEFATMLDMQVLTKECYDLEGDRLEILLVHRRLESLRHLGRKLRNCEETCLPNVQALLRAKMELRPGVEITKDFPPHGTFSACIISSSTCDSTLYPGTEAIAYKVRYPSDNKREDLEEDELRPLIKTTHLPEFNSMCAAVVPAFDYLENRLLGLCQPTFSCQEMYELCRLV